MDQATGQGIGTLIHSFERAELSDFVINSEAANQLLLIDTYRCRSLSMKDSYFSTKVLR